MPVREYRFFQGRRWRFDFAWTKERVAVEIEGGIWIQGRHNRGASFEKDAEKYNQAVLSGWKLFRFTSGMINSGLAITTIRGALNGKDAQIKSGNIETAATIKKIPKRLRD